MMPSELMFFFYIFVHVIEKLTKNIFNIIFRRVDVVKNVLGGKKWINYL